MIRYDKGKNDVSFMDIAHHHWELLNPRRTSDDAYKINESLIGRLNKAVTHFKACGEKDKAKFLRYFQNENYKQLEILIKAPAKTLNRITKKTNRKLRKYNLWQDHVFYKYLLDNVFQYRNWRSNGKFKKIFDLLDISICPYCNHQDVYIDHTRNIAVCSVDHYYDKSNYPFLSLTFSNLIPVCQICNLTYKGDLSFSTITHLHPYIDNSNENFGFDSDYVSDAIPHKLYINYVKNLNNTKSYIAGLGIEEVYQQNSVKEKAKDIFNILSIAYPKSRWEELRTMLRLANMDEVSRHICNLHSIPYSEEGIRNSYLGKLKRDLAKKYGVIGSGECNPNRVTG